MRVPRPVVMGREGSALQTSAANDQFNRRLLIRSCDPAIASEPVRSNKPILRNGRRLEMNRMRYLSVLATFLLLSGCAHTHPQSHSDVAITSVPFHCLALLADGTAIVEIRNGPHGIVAFPV